ncbi:hypothetical protein, partial [Frankia sp. CpI1-P]|uniref:hypothetical protein n=1 Tax=Frankia sp. CpI1-P TaxID=1502734 RepID=UPI001A7E42A4
MALFDKAIPLDPAAVFAAAALLDTAVLDTAVLDTVVLDTVEFKLVEFDPAAPFGVVRSRTGGSSRMTWALVPLIPNDDTAARRGP